MSSEVVLIATGDSIISRRIRQLKDREFLELRDLVSSSDVAFSNFETTTPRVPKVPSPVSGLGVSSLEYAIDELTWMGFNLFNLANNQSAVYGWQGAVDTLRAFEYRNLAFAGTGRTLSEARAPGYLDTSFGRVGLIGATVTNASTALAADPSRGTAGRPGANPLRFDFEYQLDSQQYDNLLEIDEVLGTAEARRQRERFAHGDATPDSDGTRFLGNFFQRGESSGINGRLHAKDVEGMERSIAEARRQADLVTVSVHCHEGDGGTWNTAVPPDFLIEAARRFVRAGADLVVGHGPHQLRGFEVFEGKPIFYSLGNFCLQLETVEPVPQESYEGSGLGTGSVPADYHDQLSIGPDGQPVGFAANPVWFESLVAECVFEEGQLTRLMLHPIELGFALPRPQRGVPRFVDVERGTEILERVAGIAGRFGTTLNIRATNRRAVAEVMP